MKKDFEKSDLSKNESEKDSEWLQKADSLTSLLNKPGYSTGGWSGAGEGGKLHNIEKAVDIDNVEEEDLSKLDEDLVSKEDENYEASTDFGTIADLDTVEKYLDKYVSDDERKQLEQVCNLSGATLERNDKMIDKIHLSFPLSFEFSSADLEKPEIKKRW